MSKSSAVAEMGNRLAAIDKGRKVAAVVPLSVGGAEFPSITMWPGPRATSVPSGILIHPAVWHNRHGPKSWGCCATYFWGRWVTPHLTHCRLGRGLPPYQVASWSIQPFGHNRHGPKIEGDCLCKIALIRAPFLGGGAGSPFNTMWPGPRPTSLPGGIFIYPTLCPQYTNVADRQDRTDRADRHKFWKPLWCCSEALLTYLLTYLLDAWSRLSPTP